MEKDAQALNVSILLETPSFEGRRCCLVWYLNPAPEGHVAFASRAFRRLHHTDPRLDIATTLVGNRWARHVPDRLHAICLAGCCHDEVERAVHVSNGRLQRDIKYLLGGMVTVCPHARGH